MRFKPLLLLVFCLVLLQCEAKRSSSRRSKSSSSSSSSWSLFGRKDKQTPAKKVDAPVATAPKPAPVAKPAPSAPKPEPEIKKQTNNLQQAAPPSYAESTNGQSKPIGWNVNNNQNGVKTQQGVNQQHVNPSYSQNGGYPQQSGGYPQQNAGYNQQHAGYNHQQPNGGYPQQNGGYPQQPGGYPGHQQQYGGYGQQNGGYPHQNNYQQGYPNQMGNQGGFGGMFGGNKHSSMGYGPYGYGGNGYGMKKSGGFLGKNVFRNALIGLFAWQLISGLTRRPYKVYNYYNTPPEAREEIKLPPNTLTLCSENATSLCVPGTSALCTLDGTFLCVVTMKQAVPCKDQTGEMCVSTSVPCLGPDDPICQNQTNTENGTVTLPCFTNLTMSQEQSNVTLPKSDNGQYCVTTLALPDVSADNSTNNGTNNITESGLVSSELNSLGNETVIGGNGTVSTFKPFEVLLDENGTILVTTESQFGGFANLSDFVTSSSVVSSDLIETSTNSTIS